jgi:hypothetical protein
LEALFSPKPPKPLAMAVGAMRSSRITRWRIGSVARPRNIERVSLCEAQADAPRRPRCSMAAGGSRRWRWAPSPRCRARCAALREAAADDDDTAAAAAGE